MPLSAGLEGAAVVPKLVGPVSPSLVSGGFFHAGDPALRIGLLDSEEARREANLLFVAALQSEGAKRTHAAFIAEHQPRFTGR